MRCRSYGTDPDFQSGVVCFDRDGLHTVCHLGDRDFLARQVVTRACEAGEASVSTLAMHLKKRCRKRDGEVGGPWANTRAGGVSGFLLPTFLCRGKET